jgi:hypothetical protein
MNIKLSKIKFSLFAILTLIICFFLNCIQEENIDEKPARVEIRAENGVYRLYRNGESYYIRGAGGGLEYITALAEHGGNSLRTWSTHDARNILDAAQANGITVLMSLYIERERHGFDYNNQQAVQKQFETVKKEVEKYKDHPALLAWGIGNELNLRYTNKKVWNAVEDIAKMIHEIDGNHPVTTMLAGAGKEDVDYIKDHCPSLDFLSIQLYADVINVQKRVAEVGWTGAYAITEWGATGHWEMPKTEWGAAIEQTSTERAEVVKKQYENAIKTDATQCLGSYVFLWGQKQERTPTWYGLFLESGDETGSIDVMNYLWTGTWPENRAPEIVDIKLAGKSRFDNIRLNPDQQAIFSYSIADLDNDPLKLSAEILPESTELGDGGDYEPRPETITGLIISQSEDKVIFKTPQNKGAYRIFVYIRDGHNNAATANIPFYVN